jgi:hypothetical protein
MTKCVGAKSKAAGEGPFDFAQGRSALRLGAELGLAGQPRAAIPTWTEQVNGVGPFDFPPGLARGFGKAGRVPVSDPHGRGFHVSQKRRDMGHARDFAEVRAGSLAPLVKARGVGMTGLTGMQVTCRRSYSQE